MGSEEGGYGVGRCLVRGCGGRLLGLRLERTRVRGGVISIAELGERTENRKSSSKE